MVVFWAIKYFFLKIDNNNCWSTLYCFLVDRKIKTLLVEKLFTINFICHKNIFCLTKSSLTEPPFLPHYGHPTTNVLGLWLPITIFFILKLFLKKLYVFLGDEKMWRNSKNKFHSIFENVTKHLKIFYG